jgi:hypothetical protein
MAGSSRPLELWVRWDLRLGEQPALSPAHWLLKPQDPPADMTRHQVRYQASDHQPGDVQYAHSALAPDCAGGLRRDGTPQLTEELVAELTGLRRRLDTLPVIEQSKGILIGYFGIDADTAFNVLRRWSSHTNIKLRDISQLLVDAASAPPQPGQPPRSALDHLITRLQTRDSPEKAGSRPASSLRTSDLGFRP